MPYIPVKDRKKFEKVLNKLPIPKNKGELEFCLFMIMCEYMGMGRKWNYKNLHDVAYAATHCGDEFRRRFLDRREDEALRNSEDIMEYQPINER